MIVDIHAHALPRLAGPSGHGLFEDHMKHLQHHLYFHIQGVRRARDGAPVREQTLFDGQNDGLSGMYEVNFRIGRFGRLEWTYAGEDYYVQWMPPTLADMAAPPELMIQQMDYVGVDKAVLQNVHVYGDLNKYLSECVRSYPDRFIALAVVNEWEADQESQVLRLRHAITELGLSGLYFHTEGFFMTDFRDHLDDEKLDPLWREVRRLGIPVFWDTYSSRRNQTEDYLEQARRLDRWAKKYPDIVAVFTHGLVLNYFPRRENRYEIPAEIWGVLKNPNVYLELLFNVENTVLEDYPYPLAHLVIRELCEGLGAEKLMWGSDMPAAGRQCTYRQSLDYIRNYCEFINPADMDLVLGGNAARLFDL